jgi:hypothetical protein
VQESLDFLAPQREAGPKMELQIDPKNSLDHKLGQNSENKMTKYEPARDLINERHLRSREAVCTERGKEERDERIRKKVSPVWNKTELSLVLYLQHPGPYNFFILLFRLRLQHSKYIKFARIVSDLAISF